MARSYRIAFLAPAYVGDPNAGGMASYIARMAKVLQNFGHAVEIFALTERGPGSVDYQGIPVHLVHPHTRTGHLRWYRMATRLPLLRSRRFDAQLLSGAAQLAAAFHARDQQAPFDLLQSSDYCATGWYVKPHPRRRHVVRSSNARELLAAVDQGDSKSMQRCWIHYELESMRRAEIAYTPSQYAADYYSRKLGRPIPVVRPPLHRDTLETAPIPTILPTRFLLHFGQLRTYKGTTWLLDALPLAWQLAPDLHILLVGPVRDSALRKRLASILRTEKRLLHLDTLLRPQMHAVLQKAAAAVLPSLGDNLPNTVIEALCLGIPVIGSNGASIDELMEHNRHGELVPMNDIPALAHAMARAWLGQSVQPGFSWDAPIVAQMDPLQSVLALGNLVGLDLAPPPARLPLSA